MVEQPLVSIGMPIYNCQDTLPVAVWSMINQTYQNWELFLIDDGSTDQTLSLARDFQDRRIRVLSDGLRLGLAARLNQAIALSQGKYFVRMDGDDISYPERIACQIDYLEAHPQIDLVGAEMMVFGVQGQILGKRAGPQTHLEICRRPTAGFRMFHPTYAGKLSWFRTHKYDIRSTVGQDQDLLLRTYRTSQFANIPEILLGYREEKLSLRKILRTRRFLLKAISRQLRREGRLPLLSLAIIEQILKGVLDIVAIGTGLNHRLLPQRAGRSFTAVEAQRWQQVWALLHQPEKRSNKG